MFAAGHAADSPNRTAAKTQRPIRSVSSSLRVSRHSTVQAVKRPRAAPLARPSRLVLAALDLRRALANPLPAIRAFGDIRAHFRPAVLADDEQVRLRHANPRIPAWERRPGRLRA